MYSTCCTGSDLHCQCPDWTVRVNAYTVHVVPARIYTGSVHWTDWTVRVNAYTVHVVPARIMQLLE